MARITDEYRDYVSAAIENAIRFGKECDLTYSVHRFNDNKLRWLRVIGKMTTDETGAFSNFSGIAMDVTEQRSDEQRKNDFISMVSHELKTPLTSMSGYMQILQSKAIKGGDSFSTNLLGKADNQMKKMNTMINGFLNVSRLESGKIYIDKQRFDLAVLMKEIEDETLAAIMSHQLLFAPVKPTPVVADRDKIGQVVANLISNAVKYSPAGSTIKVACVTINNLATVSVKDEGMGIAPSDAAKLFDRYYRIENQTTKSIAGFGIGLYLCKEIIERHNGTISVKSDLGKGSSFYFTLPVSQQ